MPNILVTGANGQLGRELQDIQFSYPSYSFFFYSRNELDITNEQEVRKVFERVQPVYCINCAAYTAVDKAESEPEMAQALNADAVKLLATICNEIGTRLIHISTDYVFDGSSSSPYKEDDSTNPINTYGRTKLEGEKFCQAYNPDSIIIRTSWVYSQYGSNFVNTMIRLLSIKEEISVVSDQKGSPTYAADLAEAILTIISGLNWKRGIYHFSNEGEITWFDFAMAIKEFINSSSTIHPISTSEYPTPAARPKYSLLSKEKIFHEFGISPKPWKDSLHTCLQKIYHDRK